MKILHTNDLHGSLEGGRHSRLLGLRAQSDLYFDSGDCVKSGNLAVPLRPEPVWPRLAALGCTASVPGNRESHPLEAGFRAKLAGSSHPVLCANLYTKSGSRVLPGSIVVEVGALKVGVLGVMVAMVTKKMATSPASHYLWTDPIEEAVVEAKALRGSVDVVVALTHIGHGLDRDLAGKATDIDIILGGHSHTVLSEPEVCGQTWICQGGSHGRYAGMYEWDGGLRGELVALA